MNRTPYRPSLLTSHRRRSLKVKAVKTWPVQDAQARFSELLDTCLKDGPQIVTRRGSEAAVLVPMEDWRRLNEHARPTLKDLLLSDEARFDFPLPKRGRLRRRAPKPFR